MGLLFYGRISSDESVWHRKKFGPGISFFESVWHAYSESCSSALLLLGHRLVLSIYFQSHVQVLSICLNV